MISPMPLTDHEKDELAQQVRLLTELDEPEALLATLLGVAKREASKGYGAAEARERWRILANALLKAEFEVNAAQSPEARKLAEHRAQWPAQETNAPEPNPTA
jgi:hypothetical protein